MATATKYRKMKWNPARIRRMYRAGKRVCAITQAVKYPAATGTTGFAIF
jgi:hypothetical protein